MESLNLLSKFLIISIFFLSSCTSLDYRLDERKDLLLKIIENPFGIKSIVKNSSFYDSTIFYDKDFKGLTKDDIEDQNTLTLQKIKRLSKSEFEFTVNYIQKQYYHTKPNLKLEFQYNIIGVSFKNEKMGIGIKYLLFKGKYYFVRVFTVNIEEDKEKYLNKFGL